VSRGRRLELGGFGALAGAALGGLDPPLGLAYAFGLILVGFVLQVRADRKRKAVPNRIQFVRDGETLDLDEKEREEELWRMCGTLAWEAAGRPGLPVEEGESEVGKKQEVRVP
jgi:hypothetical protein